MEHEESDIIQQLSRPQHALHGDHVWTIAFVSASKVMEADYLGSIAVWLASCFRHLLAEKQDPVPTAVHRVHSWEASL